MAKSAQKHFYITTTLPYVNAEPHVGFAMELIRADIIARAHKLDGDKVFMNTGTDEHGVKIYRKAKENNLDPQVYVDQLAEKFKELIPALGILPEINFIRTTDKEHVKAAQEFWKVVDKNGLIYKKNYKIKYCVGCELEKTESELVDGRCPIHPLQELEIIEEENYFFRFSIFQKQLLDLYETGESKDKKVARPFKVYPRTRLNEIRAFVERGLEDFSISRLAVKMPWGIPAPGNDKHVMYVWFDALVNYASAVGWPHDMVKFEKWWNESGGVVQYCGKDNLRQQAAMWQAMLLAAKIPSPQAVVVDGFITGEGGLKMSKSLGNTVNPFDVVKEYGTDALRYFVARELHPFEDGAFSMEKFKEAYNAHLANGLGNLTSRILKMAISNGITLDRKVLAKTKDENSAVLCHERLRKGLAEYDIQQATNAIWDFITETDKIVQDREPFKKIKTDKAAAEKDISELLARLHTIGTALLAIMPATAENIVSLVENGKMPEKPLFMRK